MNLPTDTVIPKYTEQLMALFELLNHLKEKNTDKHEGVEVFKGIIFVEQVAVTYPLSFLINSYFNGLKNNGSSTCDACSNLKKLEAFALPVSGTGSMLDRERNSNMDAFRAGKVPLLVSTSALEEGIDVPDCTFVIRYDPFNTTKAHIQGSGRARCKNAKIFYFKNDPFLECAKANKMDMIAKDKSLNLSQSEMRLELARSLRRGESNVEYPYYPQQSNLTSSTILRYVIL